jgi:hypothetical protein
LAYVSTISWWEIVSWELIVKKKDVLVPHLPKMTGFYNTIPVPSPTLPKELAQNILCPAQSRSGVVGLIKLEIRGVFYGENPLKAFQREGKLLQYLQNEQVLARYGSLWFSAKPRARALLLVLIEARRWWDDSGCWAGQRRKTVVADGSAQGLTAARVGTSRKFVFELYKMNDRYSSAKCVLQCLDRSESRRKAGGEEFPGELGL